MSATSLTDEQVRAIRKRAAHAIETRRETFQSIAYDYGVSERTIQRVHARQTKGAVTD